MTLRVWFYRLTSRLRHGRQCARCDRRAICHIIKAGSRPCDRTWSYQVMKELRKCDR